MDSIQDVYDIIDEEGQRIHIYHMSIDDAMVQLLEKCDVMCQADELRVFLKLSTTNSISMYQCEVSDNEINLQAHTVEQT